MRGPEHWSRRGFLGGTLAALALGRSAWAESGFTLSNATLVLHDGRRQAFRIPGFLGAEAFTGGIDHRKQGQRRNAQPQGTFGHRQQAVQTDAFDAWHRGNRLGSPGAFKNEHRINQVCCCQCRLAHQAAGKIVATHAPHARAGEYTFYNHGLGS